MFTHIRCTSAAWAVIFFALTTVLATSAAHGQCPSRVVYNYTGCALKLALRDASNNIRSYPIPAVVGPTTITQGGFDFIENVIGVVNANDKPYDFTGLPLPGCTPCIELQATTGTCCATVCYNSATCTFTITPCASPC